MNAALKQVAQILHDHAMAMREAWEDSPWGDSVVKVGKKICIQRLRTGRPHAF